MGSMLSNDRWDAQISLVMWLVDFREIEKVIENGSPRSTSLKIYLPTGAR
jgi:hypothetical protein